MDRKQIEEAIRVMAAYRDGCVIRRKTRNQIDSEWVICDFPAWNWEDSDYRIDGEIYPGDFVQLVHDEDIALISKGYVARVKAVGSVNLILHGLPGAWNRDRFALYSETYSLGMKPSDLAL